MIKLRKILSVIYLISFLVLAALLVPYWFGIDPIASFMDSVRSDPWMRNIILAALGISTVGTVGYVVHTISHRGKNTFQKSSNELGSVQISRAAIVREVNNVLDSHPELKKQKVDVIIKNHRHPYSKVEVRVAPRGSFNMPDVAVGLQREIKEAVERLTGNEVRSVAVDIRRQLGDEEFPVPETEPAVSDATEAPSMVEAEAPEAMALPEETMALPEEATAFEAGDGGFANGESATEVMEPAADEGQDLADESADDGK